VKTEVIVQSNKLSKGDLILLLQAIRDCEQRNFPDETITILVDVPEFTIAEMSEVLASIKPPFAHGPAVFRFVNPKEV